ncbi:Homeobox-leucine zipper protein GLABRA 2 [Heracleum sosnowskyi]|uniref:Homeobox-leucine zipper protein GLABRA 2 n=1 Tax=Heracleum sosnowskyi TaxID=360622 RepID=A0AAD8HAF0_9APIA|nr:Homeobox-leucine zipper protein GLABRA 2 [Heracleum sosnowskyi]
MGMDLMSNKPPLNPNHNQNQNPTKNLFPSPALSLSLAGIFRHGGGTSKNYMDVEEGDEANNGGGNSSKREDITEISSENSALVLRSYNDIAADQDDDDDDEAGENKKKKRKKYHRHTLDQIREMEALFKESPHPDEKQRQELSKKLGLHPRQVKFWFQNRRTQIKAIQERHENSLLRREMNRLRDENKALREIIAKGACTNCGVPTSAKDAFVPSEVQQLRIENSRLKSENEKLLAVIGKYASSESPPARSTCSPGDDQDGNMKCSLDSFSSIVGLERSQIVGIVDKATEELIKMATGGEPLWIRSFETGREILNYDEYLKEFSVENFTKNRPTGSSVEASRDSGVVFMDLPTLVQHFMDANQWQEMFPCMISKAATVDVINTGEGVSKNGAIQLMFAELQMLTPVVPTREVYFVRHCKQVTADKWAIVDVSIDKLEKNIDARCFKRPSGCIIEDKSNGHSKVIWVEHMDCQKSLVPNLYRTIVNSGLAFGAGHWMKTLQLQCERLVFFMATNVPTKDSYGVGTLAGRKSILKLAQRMTRSFYRAIGASNYHTWNKATSKTGEDIRIAWRKNLNDPGEPLGVVLCAVLSVWLPVSHQNLFDFLRDETRRNEWEIIANEGPVQNIANLVKGQDHGNAVTIQAMKQKEKSVWILQDSCTNAYESTVVYAPVDISSMQSAMTGCDPSDIAILPSGFSILPDGVESRPLLISSRSEDRSTEGGSLLTIAFQILTSNSPTEKLSVESFESVNTLVSCTLQNIKTALKCEDG